MLDRLPPIVKTYSGARLHEEPRSFFWEGKWREVRELQARWQSPQGLHFRVRDEEGGVFQLSYDRGRDTWQVEPQRGRLNPT